MSIQPEDRTTIDMFSTLSPGRPKSSPYERAKQSRFNKRSQRQRDKHKGLHRLEIKLPTEIVAAMDDAADDLGISRADIIDHAIKQWLHLG